MSVGARLSDSVRPIRDKHYQNPVFLSEGFRPLFLLAGLWGALSIPLYLGVLVGMMPYSGLFHPIAWHVHEMMFGYIGAALGGFVLTAVPNWTGRPPLSGIPLASLVLVWLLGRIAVWWGSGIGLIFVAFIDLAFLGMLSVLVGKEIVAGRNWRNMPILVGVIGMFVANVLFHVSVHDPITFSGVANRLSIAVMALLLALVGGRIVPNFTRNWLANRMAPKTPVQMNWFDQAVLLVTAITLLAWVVFGPSVLAGVLLLGAGGLNLMRLVRWYGWSTVAEPLVTVLHIGYLWFAFGLFLLGLSMLTDSVTEGLALHVLSVGAFGTMTLAIMTRAALGHTGRKLQAGPWTVAIYTCATLAVFARAAFEFVPSLVLLWVAGGVWSLAFVLYTATYTPMLLQPRKS